MNRTRLTHRNWVSLTKRLLNTRTLSTSDLIASFERVAVRVERAIPAGINDWHLVQTWHLLSLQQACAGDYRAAAATLKRIVEHHQVLLVEHRRAYVAGAAAAAMELWKTGDTTGARRMLRSAERLGQGLKPQEALVHQAKALVNAAAKKRSTALANKRVERATSQRHPDSRTSRRRGSRAGR